MIEVAKVYHGKTCRGIDGPKGAPRTSTAWVGPCAFPSRWRKMCVGGVVAGQKMLHSVRFELFILHYYIACLWHVIARHAVHVEVV